MLYDKIQLLIIIHTLLQLVYRITNINNILTIKYHKLSIIIYCTLYIILYILWSLYLSRLSIIYLRLTI